MKKVDSRVKMDRHAAHAARDDRESNNSTPTTQAAVFLMRKQGCAAFCAEISLDGYRTSKRQAPCFIAKSQRDKGERR